MEGRVQLLYVDDDENDCILISESLHQLCDQCVLSCASTPEQALHRLTWTRGTESFPHLVITDGSATVSRIPGAAADATVRIKPNDARKLLTGRLKPMVALVTGKVKVEGDLKALTILQDVL